METSSNRAPITKELSVLDGLYVLVRYRWLILLLTGISLVVGVFIALTTPREYTANAVVVRESHQEVASGGLSALRGLGLNLGESGPGLTIEAYPNILTSREVQAAVIHTPLPAQSREMSMVDYQARYGKGGGLRSFLRGLLRRNSGSEGGETIVQQDSLAVSYTVDEQETMQMLGNMIDVDADVETGLMTVAVTARDPVFAANLAGLLVEELRTRVQELLTEKAREDYEFILEQTEEAEAALTRARSVLARFDDSNRGLTSARLLAQREELRQDVTFASEVFGESQSQLKRAELEVQRASPVVTVLDRPVVPLLPSKPRRSLIVAIAFLLGLCGSVLLAFVLEGLQVEATSSEGQKKRTAIRDMLIPKRFRRKSSDGRDQPDSTS